LRIGIVGTENTHVDHLVEYLNVRHEDSSARVVAIAGGHTQRNEAIAEQAGITAIVDEVADMLPLADALIVTDRDGARHRAHALPFLVEGRPVFVDKPLACSVADAYAMVSAARRSGAPLTSYSALRYAADTETLVRRAGSLAPLRSVVATGPADPNSQHGGIFFYGIHPVDVALRMAPGRLGAVRVEQIAESVVASAAVENVHVTVNLINAAPHAKLPFHMTATGRNGVQCSELRTTGNYVAPGLVVFLRMAQTGVPPIDYEQLLRPISFLEAVQAAL
jgi:predicted dehydrogenase